MKKILLAGKLTELMGNIHGFLATEHQVQLSNFDLETMKGLMKIFHPDMLVVCQNGMEELEQEIFQWLNENHKELPVLLIITRDGWEKIQNVCSGVQYEKMFRPITNRLLLARCNRILNISASEEAQTQRQYEPRRKRILVVDDSAIVLRNIKSMFEQQYEILLATSGKMALNTVINKHPDLILLDYDMPQMDGRETFEQLLAMEEGRDIPVIFLTAVDDRQKILDVLQHLPVGYILKPPDKNRLTEMIEDVLQQ